MSAAGAMRVLAPMAKSFYDMALPKLSLKALSRGRSRLHKCSLFLYSPAGALCLRCTNWGGQGGVAGPCAASVDVALLGLPPSQRVVAALCGHGEMIL